MFSFKSILYFSHNSVWYLTRFYLNNNNLLQLLLFFTLFRVHNNNCSIDLYNRDLQTTILLFTRNVSSHKSDCIFSELSSPALSCLIYALEGKCLCLREISINVNKLFTLLLFAYFVYVCPCNVVVACLLVYFLFYTALLLLPSSFFLYWCCCYIFVYSLIM